MKCTQLTPAIGASISEIDLCDAASDVQQIEVIYDLLIKHLVLFFPEQSLDPESHLRFARHFGILDVPHPVYPTVDGFKEVTLLEYGEGKKPADTNVWHTDLTFRSDPPFTSILFAHTVPEIGGDTLWASMYAAYEGLPESMKQELGDLSAFHDMGSFRNDFLGDDDNLEALNNAMTQAGSAVHPIIRRHPISGRKYIYVNRGFTHHLVDRSTPDSDRILNYLFDHINQPEYQVRLKWGAGTVAMWDNRVTQHYAVADYLPQYRRMHRVTVVNDKRAPSLAR